MVVHVFNPSILKTKASGCFETSCLHSKFQASLSYIVDLSWGKEKKKLQTNKKQNKPFEYVLPFDSFRSAP